ncbi:hypothetical protein L873DRAFT_1301173 [Choiromyces venosus 120613-1]|uniref:Uncharacterized protein n=1 Tax=Choiromyces venosus 120613-1 TaxID=1336337 RepID=A0A3N4JH91_9PEZI|nr:hypothetical protein L873DRAFT_1301173 [Choiromyces venosus 120613-1]
MEEVNNLQKLRSPIYTPHPPVAYAPDMKIWLHCEGKTAIAPPPPPCVASYSFFRVCTLSSLCDRLEIWNLGKCECSAGIQYQYSVMWRSRKNYDTRDMLWRCKIMGNPCKEISENLE